VAFPFLEKEWVGLSASIFSKKKRIYASIPYAAFYNNTLCKYILVQFFKAAHFLDSARNDSAHGHFERSRESVKGIWIGLFLIFNWYKSEIAG